MQFFLDGRLSEVPATTLLRTLETLTRPGDAPVRTGRRIIEAAEGLVPLLRAEAPAIDAGRRLTPAVVQALHQDGFFRMTMPAEFGGPTLTLGEVMRVLETLARGDASTAWCSWVACGLPATAAFMDASTAGQLFSPAGAAMCATQAPFAAHLGLGPQRAILAEPDY